MPSRITSFERGREFVANEFAPAMAAGISAVAEEVVDIAQDGMKSAKNSVVRMISKSGFEYYPGTGAKLGGFPGIRTGQLWQSMSTRPAKVARRPRAAVVASTPYAKHVHNFESGAEKRPFFSLSVRQNGDRLEKTLRRVMNRRLGVE